MLAWAAYSFKSHYEHIDWFCRLDTDTYFVAENFRRFVRRAGLDPDGAHYLGARVFFHHLMHPAIVFNFGGAGVCLSRAVLHALAARLFPLVQTMSEGVAAGPTSSTGECIVGPGHFDDIALAVCLREAGVLASEDTTDAWGREVFWPFELEAVATVQPPRLPSRVSVLAVPEGLVHSDPDTRNFYFWRSRLQLVLPCIDDVEFWLSEFPITMHFWDKNPQQFLRFHAILRYGAPSPIAYRPLLDTTEGLEQTSDDADAAP